MRNYVQTRELGSSVATEDLLAAIMDSNADVRQATKVTESQFACVYTRPLMHSVQLEFYVESRSTVFCTDDAG